MNYYDRAKFFRTKKRLGQNFLISGEIIREIIDHAQISPDDTIVEILGFDKEECISESSKILTLYRNSVKNNSI